MLKYILAKFQQFKKMIDYLKIHQEFIKTPSGLFYVLIINFHLTQSSKSNKNLNLVTRTMIGILLLSQTILCILYNKNSMTKTIYKQNF